mmetsp:Transcript_18536/g.30480  ORF Transcript_18536/g.30480 Transcript_18536/m.30480 type:complete len:217 (+) Transcript_18536:1983-2633(+)
MLPFSMLSVSETSRAKSLTKSLPEMESVWPPATNVRSFLMARTLMSLLRELEGVVWMVILSLIVVVETSMLALAPLVKKSRWTSDSKRSSLSALTKIEPAEPVAVLNETSPMAKKSNSWARRDQLAASISTVRLVSTVNVVALLKSIWSAVLLISRYSKLVTVTASVPSISVDLALTCMSPSMVWKWTSLPSGEVPVETMEMEAVVLRSRVFWATL